MKTKVRGGKTTVGQDREEERLETNREEVGIS